MSKGNPVPRYLRWKVRLYNPANRESIVRLLYIFYNTDHETCCRVWVTKGHNWSPRKIGILGWFQKHIFSCPATRSLLTDWNTCSLPSIQHERGVCLFIVMILLNGYIFSGSHLKRKLKHKWKSSGRKTLAALVSNRFGIAIFHFSIKQGANITQHIIHTY